MKRFIQTVIQLLLIIVLTQCTNDKELKLRERESVLKQKEQELKQKQEQLDNISASTTTVPDTLKYVYVQIIVNKPDITFESVDKNKYAREAWEQREKIRRESDPNDPTALTLEAPPSPDYQTVYNSNNHFYAYNSNIVEVKGLTEDARYRLIDEYLQKIRRQLDQEDGLYGVRATHARTSEIMSSKLMEFYSYAEASRSKEQH